MRRFTLSALAFAAVLLASAHSVPAQAAAGTATDVDNNLVGSWVATLTPDPASGVPAFRELLTFHADGTMTMVDDNAPGPPFPFTPGQGMWRREHGAKRTFSAHYLNLMFDPASFASAGTANVHDRIRLSADLDSFSGDSRITFADLDGNVLVDGSGTIAGTRIAAEPF